MHPYISICSKCPINIWAEAHNRIERCHGFEKEEDSGSN
jgi:hypothetical protein